MWIFKIDDHSNGMGLAIFDINPDEIANILKINKNKMLDEKISVSKIINVSLENKFNIVCKNIYENTDEYLN